MVTIRRLVPLVVVLLATLGTPASLAAQAPSLARIEGTVYDSLTARPLAGATITVIQRAAESPRYLTATSDAAGRYRVDSLPSGTYAVSFGTAFLDSLEIQLPPRDVTLSAGGSTTVDFATPSRATLAAAACPGIPLTKGRGAILGQVMDAETDRPLAHATIALSWSEIGLDLKAMRPTASERTAAVVTDSLGQYRACGVPTDTYVVMQIQQEGKAGVPVRATASDAAGVMVQNLSLSALAARPIMSDSAVVAAADTVTRLLTGTASVTGTVRGPDGRPLADVSVRVMDAAGSARSDATGHFSLGNLPAGTQILEARRVGYLVGEQAVELRAGRAVTQDLKLTSITTLDSVRIVAQRAKVGEFERRTGKGTAAGSVITASQIEKMVVSDVGDIFRSGRIVGFTLVGEGVEAKVRSTRGLNSLQKNCDANVVVDGIQHQDINLVPPSTVLGIEVYRGAAGAPAEYDSFCGVIIIWTKR